MADGSFLGVSQPSFHLITLRILVVVPSVTKNSVQAIWGLISDGQREGKWWQTAAGLGILWWKFDRSL